MIFQILDFYNFVVVVVMIIINFIFHYYYFSKNLIVFVNEHFLRIILFLKSYFFYFVIVVNIHILFGGTPDFIQFKKILSFKEYIEHIQEIINFILIFYKH